MSALDDEARGAVGTVPLAPLTPEVRRTPTTGHKRRTLLRILSVHSLFILTIVAILVFSLLEPSTFPTTFNLRSILASQAVLAMLALAETIVLAAGEFDLSIGYSMGLITILTLAVEFGSGGTALGIVVAIGLGTFIGLCNGLLIAYFKIDSFIATLASGTVVYGVSNWYTGGVEMEGTVPHLFGSIANGSIGWLPLPAIYVAVAAVLLWLVLEYLPVGRHLYAIGTSRRAAELLGIRSKRYVIGAFVAAGMIVGMSGAMTASLLQVGNPALGPEYLLPAFVGALLGATSVRPGRVNAGGTIVAVALLAVVISGLEHLGAQFFVESIFNGGTLLLATGMAGYAARRRMRAERA